MATQCDRHVIVIKCHRNQMAFDGLYDIIVSSQWTEAPRMWSVKYGEANRETLQTVLLHR